MRQRRKPLLIVPAVFVFAFVTSPARGGSLDDFERDATMPHKNAAAQTDDDCDSFIECLFDIFLHGTFDDDADDTGLSPGRRHADPETDATTLTIDPAAWFSPAVDSAPEIAPFARIATGSSSVDSDVNAIDVGGELGYGPIAMDLRHTKWREENPPDSLTLQQMHFNLRLALGKDFLIAPGIGAALLRGSSTHSGLSVTLPVRLKATDHVVLAWTPAWTSLDGGDLSDQAFDAEWHFDQVDHLGVSLGYRAVKTPGTNLDGFRAGIIMNW